MANSNEQLKYLREMLQRKAESSRYGSFVNPNDDNDFTDNLITDDISDAARIKTDMELNGMQPNLEQKPETPEETVNWWQKTVNSLEYARGNIVEGVLNVADFIFDANVLLAGLIGKAFGADDEWAKQTMLYDWQAQASNFDRLGSMNNLLSGDVFKQEYWDKWSDLGSAEASRADIKQTKEDSWIGDTSEKFQEGFDTVSIGIGELLPSIALAIVTGGSSIGVQAAIQGGLAAIEGLGAASSQAIKEGAELEKAAGYGAVKGTISGVLTAATVGIGGNVATKTGGTIVGNASKKVGATVLEKTGSVGASAFASATTKIALQAGTAAGRAAINTALDPVVKEIYDSNAIENAYGNSEAIKQTMSRIKNASECAAITSAIVGTIEEAGSFVIRGKDGYYANYMADQMNDLQGKLNNEIAKLHRDLKEGLLDPKSQEARVRLETIKNISAKIEDYGIKANDYIQKVIDNSKVTIKDKNGNQIYQGILDKEGNTKFEYSGVNKDVIKKVRTLVANKMLSDAFIDKASFVINGNNVSIDFKGNETYQASLTYNATNGETNVVVNNGNSSTNIPASVSNDGVVLQPSAKDIKTALIFVKNQTLENDNALKVKVDLNELGISGLLPNNSLVFTQKSLRDLSNGNLSFGFKDIQTMFKQIDEKTTTAPNKQYKNNINDTKAQEEYKKEQGTGEAKLYVRGSKTYLIGRQEKGSNIFIRFNNQNGEVEKVVTVPEVDFFGAMENIRKQGYKAFYRTKIVSTTIKNINELKNGDEFSISNNDYVFDGVQKVGDKEFANYHEKNNKDSTVKQQLDFFKKSIDEGNVSKKTTVENKLVLKNKNKETTKTKDNSKNAAKTENKAVEKKTESKAKNTNKKTTSNTKEVVKNENAKPESKPKNKVKPKREITVEKTKEAISNHKKGSFYIAKKGKDGKITFEKVEGQVFKFKNNKFGYVRKSGKYNVFELSTGYFVNADSLLKKMKIDNLKTIDNIVNFFYTNQNAIEKTFGQDNFAELKQSLTDFKNGVKKQPTTKVETQKQEAKPVEQKPIVKDETIKETPKTETKPATTNQESKKGKAVNTTNQESKKGKNETIKAELQEARNLWEKTIKQEQDAINKPRAEVENYDQRLETLGKVIKAFKERFGLTDDAKFKEFLKIKPTISKTNNEDYKKFELELYGKTPQDEKIYKASDYVEKPSPLEPEEIPMEIVGEYGTWTRDKIISFNDAKSIINTLSLVIANRFNLDNPEFVKVYIKKEKTAQALYQILMTAKEEKFSQALEDFVDELANVEVKYISKDKKEHIIVSNKTLDRDEIKDILKQQLVEMIGARAKDSNKAKVEKHIARLNALNDEFVKAIKELKAIKDLEVKLKPKLNALSKRIDKTYEMTNDNIVKDGLDFMLKPFALLQYTNGRGYTEKGLEENINKVLDLYTEENISGFENLEYDDNLRNRFELLKGSLSEPKMAYSRDENGNYKYDENGNLIVKSKTYRTLFLKQLQTIDEIMAMVNGLNKKARQRYVETIKPYAINTIDNLKNNKYNYRTGKLAQVYKSYARGFEPAYAVIEQVLGGSSLADVIIKDGQNARNNKLLFVGIHNDAIKDKLVELGIKNRLTKKITVNGKTMPVAVAMYVYITTNVDENYNSLEKSGIGFYDENGKWQVIAEKGEAETLKKDIKEVLPDEFIKMGDFLLDFMNNPMKEAYIKWFIQTYGEYNHRNEIGEIGKNTYWAEIRKHTLPKNAEKMVRVPIGIFKNSISRKDNDKYLVATDALSVVTTYIEQIANELYIKPVYRKVKSIESSTGVGKKTVYDVMQETIDKKDLAYIDKTLEDMLGKKDENRDILSGIMSRFSVAKLSLNISSMLKQFASIYTSNIPIPVSTKAVFQRLFQNPELKKEYLMLLNGVKNDNGSWKIEPIGGLKYRNANGNAILTANASDFDSFTETVAKYGMSGITWMDAATISIGVYSLMNIAKDQYNLEFGSEENINWVKEHWAEFELSQIGGGALSKNAIRRGDYGSLAKAIFGFLQGANVAALGSQVHKIGLYLRNRNVDATALYQEYETAKANAKEKKEAMEEARKAYEDIMEKYHEDKNSSTKEERDEKFEEYKEAEKEYSKAKSEEESTKHKKADYDSFKNAGGKKIPIYLASGIIAQGIFIALVNEFAKRLKGKKDWDEWEIKDVSTEVLLDIGVNWIPFVNEIASAIEGYEISVPAVDVMNKFVDIINSAKGKEWKPMIRELVVLLGDSTGVPVETVYQYIYGIINTFDPETAYKLKSLLYNTSLQSATNTMKKYAEKGNAKKTANMLDLIMSKYKTGETTKEVNNELAELYISGYNALPKTCLSSYTSDSGETISLTKEQINAFKTEYNKANAQVEKLMQLTDYKTKTSEERAKIIKKIYDAYYSYAKAKVLKQDKADSKLSTLLLYSNGRINVGKLVNILNKIGDITDSKNKTRKELVVAYVNRLGLSSNEKLLLLYLAGYKSTSGNVKLQTYLRSLGLSQSKVNSFLG